MFTYPVKSNGNDRWAICYLKGNENSKRVFALKPEFMTHKDQTYSLELRKMLGEKFANGRLSFTSYSIYQEFLKHNRS